MTYPCRICNVPGRVTASLHEPCPACQRDIADWDEADAIPLRRKGEIVAWAIVDAEDYARFAGFQWLCDKDGYGVRSAKRNGRNVFLRLHREILGLPPGDPRMGDHRNGDVFDCRRTNLRIVTRAQNNQNRHRADTRPDRTSQHRGVCWVRARSKWRAYVGRTYLGSFDSELEAARVASEYRRVHMPASEMDHAA